MKISPLVDAASKIASTNSELLAVLETWADMGKQQNAHPEYLRKLDQAVAVVKTTQTPKEAVAALRRKGL